MKPARDAPPVRIALMTRDDIDAVLRTFAVWHKTRLQFETYLDEQARGLRTALVAWKGKEVVGYTTIVWRSHYDPFREQDIPEIVDLNVITEHQRQGIGTALIRMAEEIARRRGYKVMGISVVQSEEYAAPNRLYPQLGYVPDGRGITVFDEELHLTRRIAPDAEGSRER